MRRIIIFIFVLGIFGFGKSQTFTLADSSVQKYDMLRVYHIQFYLAKSDIFPNSYPFLDSLADFLTKHQEIKVMEVRCHLDTRWVAESSIRLSGKRAFAIVDYLVQKGIHPNRLIPMSYDDSKPIISDQEINAMKTEEEKNTAHYINRRIEFVIMELGE
jgi:outer membrane protein OmpA-like peptidoglycan-associated protein